MEFRKKKGLVSDKWTVLQQNLPRQLDYNSAALSQEDNCFVTKCICTKHCLTTGNTLTGLGSIRTSQIVTMVKKMRDVHGDFVKAVTAPLPKFTDVFDEETFYIFSGILVIIAIIIAIVASRYVKIKDAGHVD